jgi:hypothetical protein
MEAPMTVLEFANFIANAERLLGELGHEQLIEFLAANPQAGVIIPGTGGIRKLRWAVPGRGKRGGARVIYYFHSERMPLVALDIFAKNRKEDLTEREKKLLVSAVDFLVKQFRRRT